MSVITVKAATGETFQFDENKPAGSGGMKDVFFAPDRSYVVALFRDAQDANSRERLQNICGKFRENIFQQIGGDYWINLYRWPTHVVEANGKTGIIVPAYEKEFFFEFGSKNNDFLGIKGKDKEGKWFATANHQQKYLDDRERGDWRNYLSLCVKIARSVRRMHSAGLAHSDLSYRNILINPSKGTACIIDIDGLVVPGRFPPDVIGTPDFIAPEVLRTMKLPLLDKQRSLPSIVTDRHALGVLIYMYLLYRHPLRGGKVHDLDPGRDDELSMGEKALFVEHPSDASNRPNLKNVRPTDLPFADVRKIPHQITGPYLKELFDKAFMDGLHAPELRPSADDWERALVKTVDLIQPCANTKCAQKWYVFADTTKPACPFCGTPYRGILPILNLYSSRGKGNFKPDNHRLMVYPDQYLYQWHVNRLISPNERLTPEQKKPVGYFIHHEGKWLLVNQTLPGLKDLTNKRDVLPGQPVELVDGLQLLLSPEDNGRLVQVQMVRGA